MNTFKRKALASAVLGTLGIAGTAHAIYQDPNGLGQALIYPYYTVNSDPNGNPFWTLFSVVNTTTDVKVVKVRFREGKASADVLDFNLYLSPNDVWTGAVIPASADASSPAHLVTADLSCTNPKIPATGVDFRNYQYVGANDDPLADTLDRTREGYAEMFEMGILPQPGQLSSAAIHTSTGTPTCAGLTGSNLSASVGLSITAPTGGLSGTGTIINVLSGRDTMYNANAFTDWVVGTAAYSDIGNDAPNFSQTTPEDSVVVKGPTHAAPGITTVYLSSFPGGSVASPGAMAASSTMMHSNVINEYILDAATNSDTDWVFTFPTKRLFVTTATAQPPFTAPLTSSGACETISFTYFNREEGSATASGVDFSPLPPGAAANSLCYESTILSFRNGSGNAPTSPDTPSLVLGSQNVTAVSVTPSYQNGWANVTFTGTQALVPGLAADPAFSSSLTYNETTGLGVATFTAPPSPNVFFGLPVVGFMVRTYANGLLSCSGASCLGNYMASVQHNYVTTATP